MRAPAGGPTRTALIVWAVHRRLLTIVPDGLMGVVNPCRRCAARGGDARGRAHSPPAAGGGPPFQVPSATRRPPTRWSFRLVPNNPPPSSSELLGVVGEITFFAREGDDEKALELLRRDLPRAFYPAVEAAPYPGRSKGFGAALVRASAPLGEPIAKRPVYS